MIKHTFNAITFGDVVADWRCSTGMTQKALADKMGWKQPNIVKLEQGKHPPTWPTFLKVAQIMEISPDELLNLCVITEDTSHAGN